MRFARFCVTSLPNVYSMSEEDFNKDAEVYENDNVDDNVDVNDNDNKKLYTLNTKL